MSEREKQIIQNWEKILPKMSEQELEKLASFTDGAAAMHDMMSRKADEQAEA